MNRIEEGLPLDAMKNFKHFYQSYLDLLKDTQKAAEKAASKVVRMLDLKPWQKDDLLARIKDEYDIDVKASALSASLEMIKQRVDELSEAAEKLSKKGVHPAVYSALKKAIDAGLSYEQAKAKVAKEVKGWRLSKNDYDEMKAGK